MSRLRIGVDMAATRGQKSGLGFYVEQIVSAIEKMPNTPQIVRIETIKRNLRTPERILWDQVGLPLSALTKHIDLLFVAAFSAPHFHKPIVMTAHDIFGLLYPEYFSPPARWYWSRLLPHSMHRAAHLVAISEHTKRDLITHLHIPDSRITVIPPACSSLFRPVADAAWTQKRLEALGIRRPFILSVGTLEPRKNFERLIEAFAYAKRNDVMLVLTGKKGWRYDGIFAKIHKYHLEQKVAVLNYTTPEQLLALYNECLCFILPSLYEGFGMPALEAMQCGAAVAVAQNSALPEVVGEAGILFDPYDVPGIRERMNFLLEHDAVREEMRKKSLLQAKRFSWEQTAQGVVAVFQQVMGS